MGWNLLFWGIFRAWTLLEFKLFKVMADHPGMIFSRDRLMDYIYPDKRIVSDRTIDSHIRKLRKKIEEACLEKRSSGLCTAFATSLNILNNRQAGAWYLLLAATKNETL